MPNGTQGQIHSFKHRVKIKGGNTQIVVFINSTTQVLSYQQELVLVTDESEETDQVAKVLFYNTYHELKITDQSFT